MLELTPEQMVTWFHRSYKAVDGLWFMKAEEMMDFETALDLDEKVWLVMPKIQARLLRSFAGLEKGIKPLHECLITKLELEGFEATSELFSDEKGFTVTISRCPWQDIIHDAGREHLAGAIGHRICTAEYSVWAREFGERIEFELGPEMCQGAPSCTLKFSEKT